MARCNSLKRSGGAAGFTIIEVLVALGILGLVLASALGLLSTGAVGVARADHTTRAVLVAESVLAAPVFLTISVYVITSLVDTTAPDAGLADFTIARAGDALIG